MTNLEFLQHCIAEGKKPDPSHPLLMPPPIATTIPFRMTRAEAGIGVMELDTDPARDANPMGTVHGGILCTIADAAIGMTHWATLEAGESFTSIDFKINFFRPVWKETITATARAIHGGKSVSYYECEITRADGKLVAHATSTVMTLRGEKAAGR
ncbi:MAG: PaaI family thioesterase [Acidobacteriota bacterium]|nr:PaaI family thioesterase [Acidobacteriota bacterium]